MLMLYLSTASKRLAAYWFELSGGARIVRRWCQRSARPWRLGRWVELEQGDRCAPKEGCHHDCSTVTAHLLNGETQRIMADRMKARVYSHSVDHMPLVTVPAIVVDPILEAVHERLSITQQNR